MNTSTLLAPLPDGLQVLPQPSPEGITAATLVIRHFRWDLIGDQAPSGTWVLPENAPFKDALKNASVVRWSLGPEWNTTRISVGKPIRRLNASQFPPQWVTVRPILLEWNQLCLSYGWAQTEVRIGRHAIQQQLLNSLQRTQPMAWLLFAVRQEPQSLESSDVLDGT